MHMERSVVLAKPLDSYGLVRNDIVHYLVDQITVGRDVEVVPASHFKIGNC